MTRQEELEKIISITFEGEEKRCKIYVTRRELEEFTYVAAVFGRRVQPSDPDSPRLIDFILQNT
jgi:hypothetical protein